MIDKLFSGTSSLERGLDASWMKNKVISDNIANADTPNFKSSKVEFKNLLNAEISKDGFTARKTRKGHIDFTNESSDSLLTITENTDTTMRMDGNNVDIEYEASELAKNSIYYNALAQKLNSEFARLRSAIKEGR